VNLRINDGFRIIEEVLDTHRYEFAYCPPDDTLRLIEMECDLLSLQAADHSPGCRTWLRFDEPPATTFRRKIGYAATVSEASGTSSR
jgi:hypothetical protein